MEKSNEMLILENNLFKNVKSLDYNYHFNKKTGVFIRWGKDKNDDPIYSPSPEILDLEITDICEGINGKVCQFCYKSNLPTNKKNMSFETFKIIFDKITKNKLLTQIAFGVDSHCTSNPDVWKMMEYSRENGVIPNVTVAQIDENTADKLSSLCGAVAVSVYEDKNIAYDSIEKLTKRGMKQINIHRLLSNETIEQTYEIINDIKNDHRLKNLNAIVFLSLKQKGRGIHFNKINDEQFSKLIKMVLDKGISFGFDSCTAAKFSRVSKYLDENYYNNVKNYIEPCESSLFSSYINVDGEFFPCSFVENTKGWEKGLDVVNCNDFIKDIWNNEKTIRFRNCLINCVDCNGCRYCPIYDI